MERSAEKGHWQIREHNLAPRLEWEGTFLLRPVKAGELEKRLSGLVNGTSTRRPQKDRTEIPKVFQLTCKIIKKKQPLPPGIC